MMHSKSCSYKRWELVLSGAETDPHFSDALAHVESCPVCQSKVSSSATLDMPWWDEAKASWLESELPTAKNDSTFSSVVIEVQPEMPEDSRIEFESVMLSFLEAPSHPELLGRLGRYEIERVIGTGGMGIVLKAHDSELHRVVAIKILAAHLANNASARKRFAREAQAAAAVLHPNVIPIYNVESDDKIPYLVMQCVSGSSLQSKVDNFGPLSVTDVLRIAKQTAAGLAAAHDQGLVHRDVKPANILLEDNVDRVLLSDFGLARAVDDASLTRTGVVAGTPHYMSPEQARGDAIDTRSDQFSLGSVIYFMLTGRPPFRATGAMGVLHRICSETHRPIDEVNHSVPYEISSLVDKLMAKSASERFNSMHQVELELERLLAMLQSGRISLTKRKKNWLQLFAGFRPVADVVRLLPGLRLRWAALAITSVLVGTAIAFAYMQNRPKSQVGRRIDSQELVSQWQSFVDESLVMDREFANAASELKQLQNLGYPRMPNTSSNNFDREIQTIQMEIDAFERQYPFNPLGDE